MTFSCTLEEFKQAVAEFCKAAPTCDRDSLENGKKAFTLMYLGLTDEGPNLILGKSYLDFGMKRYMDRDMVLDFGHNPLDSLKTLLGSPLYSDRANAVARASLDYARTPSVTR